MRARLGLPKTKMDGPDAVGVDLRGESYGLFDRSDREVLKLADDSREENPVNLDPRMAKLAGGVHRLDGQLMVVLDVDRVLEIVPEMLRHNAVDSHGANSSCNRNIPFGILKK